jgi:hypothetical protein
MPNHAKEAHQELLLALDAFSSQTDKDANYQATITHATHAVELFLPILLPNASSVDFIDQIDAVLSLVQVQDNVALVNLLSNLKLYLTEHHKPLEVAPNSQEALLILSLCNDTLSQLIPIAENQLSH